jgi:acyl-CoA synthetase (AMP-forming)/AMP-acid ligase II
MYGAVLHEPDREWFDTSTLRVCASGGSAMPVELLRAFEQTSHCKVLEEGCGLSETSPGESFNYPDVAQDEVGEIVIRGHNVMKGCWGRDDATAEMSRDGWFHSGDPARVEADGYFFIADRKKDMILRGGYNVYPREIEEVLYEHPAVREAAVVGLPHEEYGEGGRGGGCAQTRRRRERRGTARIRQAAGCGVQISTRGVVRRRASERTDGQDPQARHRAPGRRLSGRIQLRKAA